MYFHSSNKSEYSSYKPALKLPFGGKKQRYWLVDNIFSNLQHLSTQPIKHDELIGGNLQVIYSFSQKFLFAL